MFWVPRPFYNGQRRTDFACRFGTGFTGKEVFLYEEGVGNNPPLIGSTSEIFMRESEDYLLI
jgi:hypothetical protein